MARYRPLVVAWLSWTAVACDPRPPATSQPARSAPRPARAPAPAVAAAPGGAACPAADFPAFVGRFAENTGMQARYTRFPLEDASLEYGVDERGRGETGENVRRLARADVRWPLLPPRRQREADSLALRVDVAGDRAQAVLYKPDTDYQVAYVFARTAGCWELVRREDQSL